MVNASTLVWPAGAQTYDLSAQIPSPEEIALLVGPEGLADTITVQCSPDGGTTWGSAMPTGLTTVAGQLCQFRLAPGFVYRLRNATASPPSPVNVYFQRI